MECESQNSLDNEYDCLRELYKRCCEEILNNLHFILSQQWSAFMELQFFPDPKIDDEEMSEEEEMARKFGKVDMWEKKRSYEDSLGNCLKGCKSIPEKLIYRAIYGNWMSQHTYDFAPLFNTLVQLQGHASIFHLLNKEKEKIYSDYYDMQDKHNYKVPPSHVWNFNRLDRMMIKSDEPFIHNSAVWKLGVTYNR